MSNILEKGKCPIHNQSYVAIDFAQTVDADPLVQCAKCIDDKLSLDNFVLLNDESIIKLKEIKQKEFERQKSIIEQSLEIYYASITKIQDYMNQQNVFLNKILIQFNSEFESLKNQLNQIKELEVEDLKNSDLKELYQILNGLNTNNLDVVNDINQEKTRQFLVQVEKQLQSLDSEDKFKQILTYLNGVIYEKQVPQQTKINKHQQKDQSNKTTASFTIDSQINIVSQKINKRINFSVDKLYQFKWPYYLNTKYLKFSTYLKHSSIKISGDRKTAKSKISDGCWYLCICDQPIPKYGTVVVDFKINQLSSLMAGVCLIDSLNTNYVSSSGIFNGCYLLQHFYNSPQHYNRPQFQQNEIICMEVNVQQKQITWRNKAKHQIYTYDIQTNSDLYFCFTFCGQTEVELL